MYNLKLTAYAAGAGFILSILAGLIGEVSFGALILRALFSTILCDTFEESPDSVLDSEQKGSHVDIMLDDENLPDEDTSPSFVVNDKDELEPQVLSTTKPIADEKDASSDKEDEPVRFQAQPVNKVAQSVQEEKVDDEVDIDTIDTTKTKKLESDENASVDDESLDLPDIESVLGDFSSSSNSSSSSDSGSSDLIEDSDFAVTGNSKPAEQVKLDPSANAQELAAAIRTVIAKDN